MSRHEMRKIAFQMLFALESNQDIAIDELYYQVKDEEKETEQVPGYVHTLVTGVNEKKSDLDGTIQRFLGKGWTLARLNKIDIIVLRLAIFEIQNIEDIPNRVAINEALELTKEFSDEKSRRFVNGVLSNLIQ
ncbi:MAG: transcription antitermination factor NusB [Liquorilactobacillus hordei]|uniref:Transcription antitermination protein NusB n=2 Tax=Liquorilactobacillus hordei TaxID=468911 RepID=A0A0R1MK80_9LACO|nr:transcription antitermination factor NusB [Liquorilactobacillus hordei]AUJ29934.1 N utilization substance protein B [Liquorilactobacillus hordei]KRL08326.1 transcription antitermination protein NusB [Liquorilactobacillus hordei DSM 19519]MBZ2404806.1 transcription antitermination factor NusB [Liquorilactobacillus hordei]QYH53164.1 transcription antitermination factor NusB [Liquorilactobacillus hordei DSM 19519]